MAPKCQTHPVTNQRVKVVAKVDVAVAVVVNALPPQVRTTQGLTTTTTHHQPANNQLTRAHPPTRTRLQAQMASA